MTSNISSYLFFYKMQNPNFLNLRKKRIFMEKYEGKRRIQDFNLWSFILNSYKWKVRNTYLHLCRWMKPPVAY